MPGKSGHSKGKHPSRSQRRKGIQKLRMERRHSPAINTQQQTVAEADESAPAPAVAAPVRAAPAKATPAISTSKPATKVAAVQYPYIGMELQRIGILAGVMLVILVVLALVLS